MTVAAISGRRHAPGQLAMAPAQPGLNKILVVTLLLVATGLLMMTSASIEIAASLHGDPFYYLKRQGTFAIMGFAAMLLTMLIPVQVWRKNSTWLLVVSYLLLVLVLIPGVGKTVNGSTRWIDLGFVRLQASELVKIFMVIFLAAYLEKNQDLVRESWRGFIEPLLAVAGTVVLLHFEPDHGAMVIIMATAFALLFLAGARLYRFILMLLGCSVGIAAIAVMKPYVLQRFSSFMNPWSAENVYGGGYQLTQALIAFGRGEWSGVGLGNSIQKLYFLPEAHNDFVLAIIGEELGIVGVAWVILLLSALVYLALSVGFRAQSVGRHFYAYFAFGLGILFAGQALINIGVNTGLLPTKGLTLPFLSYGGASLIVCCFMIGLLLRLDYEVSCESGLGQGGKRGG